MYFLSVEESIFCSLCHSLLLQASKTSNFDWTWISPCFPNYLYMLPGILCRLLPLPSISWYHCSIIIAVFLSLFPLCVWCFPASQAHLNWHDGVCLCVVDIIPRRVNKGYAPSTRGPRRNKGLGAALECKGGRETLKNKESLKSKQQLYFWLITNRQAQTECVCELKSVKGTWKS